MSTKVEWIAQAAKMEAERDYLGRMLAKQIEANGIAAQRASQINKELRAENERLRKFGELKCHSCGEPLNGNCSRCQKLWES